MTSFWEHENNLHSGHLLTTVGKTWECAENLHLSAFCCALDVHVDTDCHDVSARQPAF